MTGSNGRKSLDFERSSAGSRFSAALWSAIRNSALLLVLIGGAGCAQWSQEPASTGAPLVPQTQKSLDSVLIETVLVRFPKAKQDSFQQIWSTVDETYFDIDTRSALDKNGLRAGLIIGDLPKAIRDQIAETALAQNTDALEHAGLAADADNKMRQLQCRSGRRKELIVRPQLSESLTVLTHLHDATQGETYERPTVLFDLRAIPHGDKQATIELTPEIQHGDLRQSFVSTDFGVRPEMRRPRVAWRELAIQAKLKPGQVLLVASTFPAKGLGKAFFTTKTADQTHEHVILLLRLVETQLDELFAPEEIAKAQAMSER